MNHHIVLPASTQLVPRGDYPGAAFRQAKHYRFGRRNPAGSPRGIFWIVIHSAECGETLNAAENLAAYAATMTGREASWHYAVDADSITQSVLEKDTAWHAPPLNTYSIGIELAGRANQLVSGWEDDYSHRMLEERLVPLLANLCERHGILPRVVSDDLLKVGLDRASKIADSDDERASVRTIYSGIVTHAQISRTFRKSSHSDPGQHFPMKRVLDASLKRIDRIAFEATTPLPKRSE